MCFIMCFVLALSKNDKAKLLKSLNINQLQQNQYFTYQIKIDLKNLGLY